MAYATFTWECSVDTKGKTTHSPLVAQFGEGYKQMAGDGRNAPVRSVNVSVGPMAEAEAIAINNFLDAQGGLPFQWTPPKPLPQVLGLWTCGDHDFDRSDGGTIHGLTAVFASFNGP